MSVRKVIELTNEAVAAGVIDEYAIGGAVALAFYMEPVATLDIDVFSRRDWEAFREYLVRRGGQRRDEYVTVADWDVQILPLVSPLVEEAFALAPTHDIGGVSARAFSLEHLAAIALETARLKDMTRLAQILDSGRLDRARFQEIVARFDLAEAWGEFERRNPQ